MADNINRFSDGHFTFAPEGAKVVKLPNGRIRVVSPEKQKNPKTTKKKKK